MNKELEALDRIKLLANTHYANSCHRTITKSDTMLLEAQIYDNVDIIKQTLTPKLDSEVEEAISSIDKLLNICKLEFDEMSESMESEMFEVELSNYGKHINTIKQALNDKDNLLDKASKDLRHWLDMYSKSQFKLNEIREVVDPIAEDYLISMGEESKRRLAIKIKQILEIK